MQHTKQLKQDSIVWHWKGTKFENESNDSEGNWNYFSSTLVVTHSLKTYFLMKGSIKISELISKYESNEFIIYPMHKHNKIIVKNLIKNFVESFLCFW